MRLAVLNLGGEPTMGSSGIVGFVAGRSGAGALISVGPAGRLGCPRPRLGEGRRARVAGLIEADLVEPGEPVVVAGQHGVVLDDAGLVR
jgi:hypothetical protein